MIRVGFILSGDPGVWTGGLNYFSSLLGAIETIEERRIEPILLTDQRHAQAWSDLFPNVRHLSTTLLDRWSPAWMLRKGVQLVARRDLLLQQRLRDLGVSCLSHGTPLGSGATLPVIGWIPDFQHVHLPEFFSREELRNRDATFKKICARCDRVIVSSQDAAKDLAAFCPSAMDRVRVLNFVPRMPEIGTLTPLARLQQVYGFTEPYFHLPSQFWKHKNHAVVIEALKILRESGRPILVLATGHTQDYRNPHHFEALQEQICKAGVGTDFRILGLVPVLDMLGLMQASAGIINPSRFEGWSTTVEEARRLGVTALLSDLPIHREQAIPGARYFRPDDAIGLAKLMMETIQAPVAPAPNSNHESSYNSFGVSYQAIVVDLFHGQK